MEEPVICEWGVSAFSTAGSDIVSKHTVAAPDWLPSACVTTWKLAELYLIWACAEVCYGLQAWRVSDKGTDISWLEYDATAPFDSNTNLKVFS